MSQSSKNEFIALYGSLMRGLGAQQELGLVDQLEYVGPCEWEGRLFDLGDYPGMRHGRGRILGEVYALKSPDTLSRLDDFEGCDPLQPKSSLYLRERIALRLLPEADAPASATFTAEAPVTEAWVYVYNHVPDPTSRVECGDWRDYLANRDQP